MNGHLIFFRIGHVCNIHAFSVPSLEYPMMLGQSIFRNLRLSFPRYGSANFIRCIGSSQPPSSSDTANSRTTSFGFRTVPEEEKESLVKNVFDSVASSYDLMNDASSLGVHRIWKDAFVSSLKPGKKGPKRCLDVAGGTGDIALRILDHAREEYGDRETTVEVVDINSEMLREGVRRFKKTMYHNSKHRRTLRSVLDSLIFDSIPDIIS
jgi:2-methoxy-6-polyprenyl-1,4-benzoquinol methylase